MRTVQKKIRDDAVSPVVGVMLMIVVVVIIAAVVSMFATGMLSDTKAAPGVQIGYVGVMDGELGEASKIGLVFQNLGGDDFRLDEISLMLKSDDDETSISYDDLPSEMIINAGANATTSVLKSNPYKAYRFSKLPARVNGEEAITELSTQVRAGSNLLIEPGERFIILADTYLADEKTGTGKVYYVAERGSSGNPYSEGWFSVSTKTTYSIIDENSGAVIASGKLVGSVI